MPQFNEVLHQLRKEKGLNQDELASYLKISRATLSDYERGKTEPNFSTLVQIARFFGVSVDSVLGNLILPDQIGKNKGNGNGKGNAKGNLIGQNQVMMPKVVTVDSAGRDNVVLVPARAQAGYLNGYEDVEFVQTLPAYSLPGLTNGTFRMFEIKGHSMVPTYHDSDIAITRFVESIAEVRDDRVHIVLTKADGIVAKRVLNRVGTDGKLILNSDNQRHPGEYPPIVVSPEEILEIWYVVAFMSRQMRRPGEIYNRLIDVEGRLTLIEDERKKLKR